MHDPGHSEKPYTEIPLTTSSEPTYAYEASFIALKQDLVLSPAGLCCQ